MYTLDELRPILLEMEARGEVLLRDRDGDADGDAYVIHLV